MIATASQPLHPGVWPRTATDGFTEYPVARAAGRGGIVNISRPALAWRWRSVLEDVLALAAAVASVPFMVLVVGTPIALAIVALLWAGNLALSAF